MNETSFGLESAIRDIVAEEISRKLETLLAVQALGENKAAEQNREVEYITVDELSAITGLKKATIYAKRSRREMPAYKFGRELRFRRDEIDAWMQSKQLFCITEDKGNDRR